MGEAKDVAIKEFKASNEFTILLDRNYATSFEDFRMEALEHLFEMDFSPIKLCVVTESSLLQTNFKEINVEDDTSTQPAMDNPKSRDNAPSGL